MKRLFVWICLICLVCSGALVGCEYDKDGDAGYVPRDEYVLPTTGTAEVGTVPYAVAKLIEKGQVVRDYNQLKAAPIGAEEAYSIRTNGLNVELYRFAEDSKLFLKIKELGVYPIMDEEGNVLATRRAAVNGNIVLMIPADTNERAESVTEMNDRLVERFESLKLN